jgi:SPFH domain / Band 7 family
VPTGRLIIVDRTPYNREWVASQSRGTSTNDESFPCQSAEGLDVTVDISISTFVTEENAAKFLYWFGVNPPQGDRTKPEVIFTSVFYGKSLQQVMDSVGRGKVQALVCGEIASRPLDKVNSEATKIIETIQQKVADYLASRGITLDYIGWADTFTFDPKVQDAINRQFVAGKEKDIAAQLGPVTETVQALATAEATRTIANKWNGATPSSVSLWWLPSGLSDWLSGFLKQKP